MSIPDEQRSSFTQQALGTMGVDPEWDRMLSAYLSAEALQFADEKWGVYSEANDAYSRELTLLNQRHGQSPRTPQIRVLFASANANLERAYEAWAAQYFRPFLQAAWDLAAYPSPSLAAVLFKVELIHRDEIWNDNEFEGDAMAIVIQDMARLSAPDPVRHVQQTAPARPVADDSELLSAWSTRQQALATIEARGPLFRSEHHSPAEARILTSAEIEMSNLPARTIEGVISKLWVGLSHGVSVRTGDEESVASLAIHDADLPGVATIESDLDFGPRLIFSAIRDLAALTGQEARA